MKAYTTGIFWTPESLRQKHRFLRKITEPVVFHLLLFPYWTGMFLGEVKGRWFPGREIRQMRIMDAVGGRTYLISAPPESFEDSWEYAEMPSEGFSAGLSNGFAEGSEKIGHAPENALREISGDVSGEISRHAPENALSGALREYPETLCPALVRSAALNQDLSVRHMEQILPRQEEEKAKQSLSQAVLADWNRKYNKILRPRVEVSLVETRMDLLYKPYWVMTPASQSSRQYQENPASCRLFAFDASTGMGGLSEFRPLLEYWWQSRGLQFAEK